jgi:polysaccharide export outer membrane protein
MKIKSIYGLVLLFVLSLTSCVSTKKMIYLQGVDSMLTNPEQIAQQYEIRIKPDDQLYIVLNCKDPDLMKPFANSQVLGSSGQSGSSMSDTQGLQVGKDGKINVPLLGEMQAAGLTRQELADIIAKKLNDGEYMKNPTVNVRIKGFKVSVMGEVKSPGVKEITGDRATILEALSMAGDLPPTARRDSILVVRENNNQRQAYYVDLTNSKSIFSSPCYYLQQNDVVYVEPNKSIRVQGSSTMTTLSAVGSVVSLVASILTLILIFVK